MNILAVNGSPRGPKGNTDHIVQPFLEGARGAGAAAETIYIKDYKIKPCQGCFTCQLKTPGVCIHNDDMTGIIDKMKAADVLVFSAPLYIYSVPSIFKAFMDRLFVIVDTRLKFVNGLTSHPARFPDIKWKMVLISNGGFPEDDHFQPLKDTFALFARGLEGGENMKFVASICKGMGELFSNEPLLPGLEWFFEACRQAGAELVENGGISEQTRAILDRPLMDVSPAEFAEMANFYIDKAAGILGGKEKGRG